MKTHHPNPRRLVYGHAQLHDCLAFADANTATEEAEEIKALAAARTWGEARQVQMTHLWNPAGPECYEPEDDDYADGKPFDINELGTVMEGDADRVPQRSERHQGALVVIRQPLLVGVLPGQLREPDADVRAQARSNALLDVVERREESRTRRRDGRGRKHCHGAGTTRREPEVVFNTSHPRS
ncbi:hypothetical protein [Micromonospora sp. CA-244673]|uniref:hypothetical protein n=1 Tax=Micromonospora sp. CA-244673 TaxID=3239958 RepID=UPI003D8F8F91